MTSRPETTRLSRCRRAALLLAAATLLFAAGCSKDEQADGGIQCTSTGKPAHVGGTWVVAGSGERRNCLDETWELPFELGPATLEVVMTDPNQYDAAVQYDAGPDGSASDGGLPDGGLADAATADAGLPDGGLLDAGLPDAEVPDGGLLDGGLLDADVPDGGLLDGGLADAATADAGLPDGGLLDGGLLDAGLPDADAATELHDAAVVDTAPTTYLPATLRLRSPIAGFDFEGQVQGECVTFQTAEVTADGTVTYSFTGLYESFGRRIRGRFTSSGPRGCAASGSFTVELQ
jgi:hypothetical protein